MMFHSSRPEANFKSQCVQGGRLHNNCRLNMKSEAQARATTSCKSKLAREHPSAQVPHIRFQPAPRNWQKAVMAHRQKKWAAQRLPTAGRP